MPQKKSRATLHPPSDHPSDEVLVLADAVGNASVSLTQVMNDFLKIVPNPVIAGGFAMAHHGFVRATVDIDVIAIGSIRSMIEEFKQLGYKHENVILPIGSLDLLSKGNKGVDFIHLKNEKLLETIAQRSVEGTFLKQGVRFVSLEDLILLKYLAIDGRNNKMDAADLDRLLAQPYDESYVKRWKTALKIS